MPTLDQMEHGLRMQQLEPYFMGKIQLAFKPIATNNTPRQMGITAALACLLTTPKPPRIRASLRAIFPLQQHTMQVMQITQLTGGAGHNKATIQMPHQVFPVNPIPPIHPILHQAKPPQLLIP